MHMRSQSGFSFIELLVAMAITLIVVSATLGAFNQAVRTNEAATLMADMEQNLRAGANLIIRDLIQAGQGIPVGGIPIPSGTGAQPIQRPSPSGSSYTFPTNYVVLPSVTPGASIGHSVLGQPTDMLTVLYADSTLPLNSNTLQSVADNGSSMVVKSTTPIGGQNNAIRPGDLIMLSNGLGNAIQQVTRVSGQTVFFDTGDTFRLNQPTVGQGSVSCLRTGGTDGNSCTDNTGPFPGGGNTTTATRVWMTTYYLDATFNANMPRLMRQINFGTARPVALVLENLQVSYDMVDGVTNPTNVKSPANPNQVRNVNLWLRARSSAPFGQNRQFFRNEIGTQVSLRSLAFVDRYR